ncbi:hypothetical protein B0H15DRAFT_747320, partial [Mycena belliarum]
SAVLLVSAVPTPYADGCSTTGVTMDLPVGQTQLVEPSTAPLFVTLGVGIQNYTCNAATSKYTSTGAVATLLDLSCVAHTPAFSNVQTVAYIAWAAAPSGVSLDSIIPDVCASAILGYHYFVPAASGTGITPKWDFSASNRGFVLGAKVGDIPAPAPARDVDWLALNNAGGDLAQQIFRTDTVSGQPSTSCIAGSADISVKYTAKYLLY